MNSSSIFRVERPHCRRLYAIVFMPSLPVHPKLRLVAVQARALTPGVGANVLGTRDERDQPNQGQKGGNRHTIVASLPG